MYFLIEGSSTLLKMINAAFCRRLNKPNHKWRLDWKKTVMQFITQSPLSPSCFVGRLPTGIEIEWANPHSSGVIFLTQTPRPILLAERINVMSVNNRLNNRCFPHTLNKNVVLYSRPSPSLNTSSEKNDRHLDMWPPGWSGPSRIAACLMDIDIVMFGRSSNC